MDRRRFLQMFGGGMVATATMAEVGFFADFMAWVKRMPVWSFPSKPTINATIEQYADFASFSDMALATSLRDLATIYYDRRALENLAINFKYKEYSQPIKMQRYYLNG